MINAKHSDESNKVSADNTRPLRILFSTDQFYKHGGIEKSLAEKANYFSEVYGYDVYILTTEQKGNPSCYPLSDRVKNIDIGINYDRHVSNFALTNLKRLPAHFIRSGEAINKIDPDIIICCNYDFDFYWLPYRFRAAKIKEIHASWYNKKAELEQNPTVTSKLRNQLDNHIRAQFDRMILLNQSEKQFFDLDNIAVIPNPISATSKTAALTNKKVLAAGRIAPVKGFDNLIRAWKIVSAQYPEWQLDIYGEDYLNTLAGLKELTAELDLQNSVHFPGTISDMTSAMTQYSIYAMSSHTECFPMVLLESLAVGLPIVSYDCPTGPRHIVTDGQDGLLAEDQKIAALADKIVLLISDEAMRKDFGRNAKINSSRFESAVVMKAWRDLFITLTSVND